VIISDYLNESIRSGEIREIRGALLGYIDTDPGFRTNDFFEAAKYAERMYGKPIFDKHDPEIFSEGNRPDRERFYEIRAALTSNFSKERIEELKTVGRRCMMHADVYTLTNHSVRSAPSAADRMTGNQYSAGMKGSVVNPPGSYAAKKANGQNQRVVRGHRLWIAILLAILAALILILWAVKG